MYSILDNEYGGDVVGVSSETVVGRPTSYNVSSKQLHQSCTGSYLKVFPVQFSAESESITV